MTGSPNESYTRRSNPSCLRRQTASCERYIKAHEAGWKNERHAEQWSSTLETYACPMIGNLAAHAIGVADVLRVLEQELPPFKGFPAGRLWTAQPETVSRIRGRIDAIIGRATAKGLRKGENPGRWRGQKYSAEAIEGRQGLASPGPPLFRHRRLSRASLPSLSRALRGVAQSRH